MNQSTAIQNNYSRRPQMGVAGHRNASHIERRLGFLKTNDVLSEVATVSGASFCGRVVSFDETAIVIQPAGTTEPSDLVTVAMRGLEFVAPYKGKGQSPVIIEG